MKPETSAFLDKAMNAALASAKTLGWSDEGRAVYVRNAMDAAYIKAAEMELPPKESIAA